MTDFELEFIYNGFKSIQEKREKENFKNVMIGLEAGLVDDLNKAYAAGDMEEYNRQVKNIKEHGFRVFRNSEGDHKLKFI